MGEQKPGFGGMAYKWWTLIVTSVALAIASITVSSVSIALPVMGRDFGAPVALLQWVVAIYPLVSVGLMLGLGNLSDRLGRKPVFTTGALLFAASSVLCGLAQNPWQLIGFRSVQAIANAAIQANYAAIVTDAFSANERGKALGAQTMVAPIFFAVGPTIGGWLVDIGGWRAVFLLPVPVAFLTGLISLLFLRERPNHYRDAGKSFDGGGAALLFLSATSFLLALSRGQESGWLAWQSIALDAIFAVSTIALVSVERRVGVPTIDLDLIRRRAFAVGCTTALAGQIGFAGVTFLTPFYLTRTVGYAPTEAGLLIGTGMVTMAFSASVSGWLSDRYGPRALCPIGMATSCLGLVILALLGQYPATVWLLLGLALFGIGYGLWISPNGNAVLGATPPERVGMGAALLPTVYQLGMALGVTISGVVFSSRLAAYSASPAPVGGVAFDTVASVGAFRDVFLILALAAFLGAVTSRIQRTKAANCKVGSAATIGER